MHTAYSDFDALDSISKQIDITARKLNISVKKVTERGTKDIIQDFCNKYCNNKKELYLWEGICKSVNETGLECVAVSNKDAWSWIGEFINKSATLFFNPQDEKVAYEFDRGKDIVDVLADCYSFEFYIVDKSLNFVICFNHHNILYACGTAVSWLMKYKTSEWDEFSKNR